MATQTGFLDLGDGQLYYEVAGEGHPLVLIHAGVANNRMWDEQFTVFAEHYRVIRYDERGFGQTRSQRKEGFSDTDDLYALLKHLTVDRTYVLGLSRGGQIAIDFTVAHPEMVNALIPVAAGVSGFPPVFSDTEKRYIAEIEKVDASGDLVKLNEMEVHLWMDGLRRTGPPPDPVARQKLSEMNYQALTHPDGSLKPKRPDPPAIDHLAEIKVPTLVIWGDVDMLTVEKTGVLLTEKIPGARKFVFSNVAHMVNVERPQEFNQLVLDFLGGLHVH
ncbi:MAG: alpha/beta fold hydrolase [Aggregatilineales bacterium]